MFIFLRLLLAHFIGDFPLQFDLIFKLKHKGIYGVALHAFIIFVTGALFCWPYLNRPSLWIFLVFIFTTHLIQDAVKINYSTPKYSFWTYLLDQLFHVGLISLVFFTNLGHLPRPALPSGFFSQLYLNDFFIAYCIIIILASYNGHYLIRCFHDSFLNRAEYNSAEKWYGKFERAAVVLIFLVNKLSLLLLIILLIITSRFIFFYLFKNKLTLQDDFISLREFLLSWSVAALAASPLMLF